MKVGKRWAIAANHPKAPASYKFFQRTTLAFMVTGALGAIVAPTTYAQAQSPAQSSTRSFDIAAQGLDAALRVFAIQSGQQVLFDDAAVTGRRAPAVQGRYTPREALDRLLAGSGIEVIQSRNGAYTLKQKQQPTSSNAAGDVATLPAVRVIGSAEDEVNPPTTVGSKTPLTQRQIPQTVSVIAQEQIQDQDLRTISDVLSYAPGVKVMESSLNTDVGNVVYSRGWQITNYNIDGIPTMITGLPVTSTATYDRVEILHGASGLYNGLGGAGGTINAVRKQPQKDYAFNSSLGAGTNDSYQGQIDVTGSLNQPGTLRGRGVVAWQRTGYDDSAYSKTSTFYGVLEADVAPQTTAQIGASYDANNGRPERFFPTYADGTFFDASRSDYHYPSWARYTNDTSTIFGNISHKFDNGWMAKFSASYIHTNWTFLRASSSTAINSNGEVFGAYSDPYGRSRQSVYDLYADGPLTLFGRKHQFTVGTNYSRTVNSYNLRSVFYGNYNFEDNDILQVQPDFSNANLDRFHRSDTKNYGVYANARFSLADPLTLIIGGRLGWYKSDSSDSFSWAEAKYDYKNKFTPFTGLVYDINKNYSAYASYSSIYQPSSLTDTSGNALEPLEGEQYEIGIKGSHLDDHVTTSLALFRGTQKNRAICDPTDPTCTYYLATGKARVQGVEVMVSGEIIKNLTLSGGYTYLNTKILDDNTSGTTFGQYSPKHMLKAWANYKLPGTFSSWKIGGGLTVISPTIVEGDGFRIHAPGYALVDGSVRYQWNRNIQIGLNVKNIFDRYYWSTIGSAGVGNFLGQGRTVMLTVNASY